MKKIDIKTIKNYCSKRKIQWTNHTISKLLQRNISQLDVEIALNEGEIIEHYANDYPFPSCLVKGFTSNMSCLHIVLAVNDEKLWIITAYSPSLDQWESDFKTRRSVKE